MNRRTAIQGIVFFTLGSSTLFSCKDKYEAIKGLNLQHLKPTSDQIGFIDLLAQNIVPIQSIPALENHTTLPFILQKVNDCYSKKDRDQFIMGYEKFGEFIKSKLNKSFSDCSEDEKLALLTELNESPKETIPEHIRFLFGSIKSESINYLSNTEFIQRQVRYYEMGPARFDGCMPIDQLTNKNKSNNG